MTCDIISTGGIGNAVLVNGCLLFDCGVPYSKLEPHVKGISLVFLTHIHADHFKVRTIQKLKRMRPMARFVCSSNLISALVLRCGVPLERIIMVRPEDGTREIQDWNNRQEILVDSFHLLHDVENVGYIVRISGEDGGSAMYATDTHHIPIAAPDLDLYMIEGNYTQEDIQRRIKDKSEAGAFSYEGRVLQSHMSVETAMDWLRDNADPYKSKIVFLHGHTEKKEGELDGRAEAVYHV